MQKLGLIGKQLTEVLTLVGYSSDIGKEVLQMITKLSKLAPSDPNAAAERRNIEQMAMKNTQQNQQMQQLKQQQAGGGGQPGAGGAPPPAQPGAQPGMGGMPRAA